jgi:hypothetical protein
MQEVGLNHTQKAQVQHGILVDTFIVTFVSHLFCSTTEVFTPTPHWREVPPTGEVIDIQLGAQSRDRLSAYLAHPHDGLAQECAIVMGKMLNHMQITGQVRT